MFKNPFKNKVKCEECKLWLDKEDAYVVKHDTLNLFYSNLFLTLYYCPKDKKPYTRSKYVSFENNKYYAELEVEKDGTPVGYKKIK